METVLLWFNKVLPFRLATFKLFGSQSANLIDTFTHSQEFSLCWWKYGSIAERFDVGRSHLPVLRRDFSLITSTSSSHYCQAV